MQIGNFNSMNTSNLGENIINLNYSTNLFDTENSSNSTNITYESKNIVILDQEKGLEKEALIEKESTLLIKENISKDIKDQNKNLEIENNFNKNSNLRLKHYGNTYPFYFNKEGEPLLVIGPHCKIFFN